MKIKVLVENKKYDITTEDKTQNLLQILISGGINIYASCGGKGSCGKCKVKIISGEYYTEKSQFISFEEQKQNVVLACKTYPLSDLTVEVLKEAQIQYVKTIETQTGLNQKVFYENINNELEKRGLDLSPIVKIIKMNLAPPSLENPTADVDRIIQTLNKQINSFVVIENNLLLKTIPDFLRKNNWSLATVICEKFCVDKPIYEIIDILPISHELKNYAAVVDVGTTTVVVSLVDLNNLTVVETRSMLNKQSVYGQDIISRIIYSETETGSEELKQKIVDTINTLIDVIVSNNNINFRDIYTTVVAGNTTMLHLLFGFPAKYIRREPYTPVVNNLLPTKPQEIGIMINSNGKIYSLPMPASYVGGDIVAGVVACNIDKEDKICVLLDLGTNGEIVVGNKEFLVSAACSCGPAFEGSGINCGMMATSGAIEDIEITDKEIRYKTIDNKKPLGICGSGLIVIPVELFRAGVIDRTGKFLDDVKNKFLKQRIRKNDDNEPEFVIVNKEHSGNSKDIVITESDIQNILRSKGAIFHGLYTLLRYLNLKFSDIDKIYISGGFGNMLNIRSAQVLGLLPDIEEEKFVFSGNTSLFGAMLYLLSNQARNRVKKVAEKMTYVDLSSLPMYMNEYTSSLFIPHTDFSLFPNVMKHLKNNK